MPAMAVFLRHESGASPEIQLVGLSDGLGPSGRDFRIQVAISDVDSGVRAIDGDMLAYLRAPQPE